MWMECDSSDAMGEPVNHQGNRNREEQLAELLRLMREADPAECPRGVALRHNDVAEILIRLDRRSDAITHWRNAAALCGPETPEGLDARLWLADTLSKSSCVADAVEAQGFVDTMFSSRLPPEDIARVHFVAMMMEERKGHYRRAIEHGQAAVGLTKPTSTIGSEVRSQIANTLGNRGRIHDGLQVLREVTDSGIVSSSVCKARVMIASLLLRAHEYEQACQELTVIRRHQELLDDCDRIELLVTQALALDQQGRFAEALEMTALSITLIKESGIPDRLGSALSICLRIAVEGGELDLARNVLDELSEVEGGARGSDFVCFYEAVLQARHKRFLHAMWWLAVLIVRHPRSPVLRSSEWFKRAFGARSQPQHPRK